MARPLAARRHLLLSTCLIALSAAPVLAFNPNDELQATSSMGIPANARVANTISAGAPLYTPGAVTPTMNYVSPLAPVAMPAAPLYSSQAMAQTAMPAPVTSPALPPVDPAVAARAQAIMDAENAAAVPQPMAQPLAAPASGFIAPAPVLAIAPPQVSVTPVPVAATTYYKPAAPVVVTPTIAPPVPVVVAAVPQPLMAQPAPAPELSDQTRTILSHVPANLDTPKPAGKAITMDRVDPEIKEVLGKAPIEDSFESVGLSIKVSRPGLDANYELDRAYTALMGGDTQTAIETYKNIISVDPKNEDALFGLAATYHRLGMIDKARPLYGMLLSLNPNHREGLNNFLVMVTDESPQDALPELQRLEERNPEFSPIPAQIAIVLDKLNYPDAAREKMLRAIELAPDNLSYQYNLAVMLDHQGQYADAAAMYQSLIRASLQGAAVPASTEAMQKRLNFLVTQATQARTAAADRQ